MSTATATRDSDEIISHKVRQQMTLYSGHDVLEVDRAD